MYKYYIVYLVREKQDTFVKSSVVSMPYPLSTEKGLHYLIKDLENKHNSNNVVLFSWRKLNK